MTDYYAELEPDGYEHTARNPLTGTRMVTQRGRGRSKRKTNPRAASGPPHTWTPRPYQQDALDAFHDGKRRQILIWHRRAGKDNFALNLAAGEADAHVGTYWHLYPTHVQAKRAIFNGIDKRGVRFLDQAFPLDRRVATRKADMQIELDNGSMWQLCGSDRYNSLVGSNPRGVVFSEWALCDPAAWDYIRPIIRENGGWVVFITTLRGKNHAYRMAKKLADNPDWHVDFRTIEDTRDSDGNPIITLADIEAERAEGMSEALLQQEYYCNPVAALEGAVYGRSYEKLREAGRVGTFAYDASRPVFASWSLEWDAQYTVVFFQQVGNETRVIGSRSYPYEPLSDCVDHAVTAYPWRYVSRHIVPPNTAAEAIDIIERNSQGVVDKAPEVDNWFTVTREALNLMWIDNAPRPYTEEEENNERLLDALGGYRFAQAQGLPSYTNRTVDSWEKNYARAIEIYSAWRYDEPLFSGWHAAPDYSQHDRRVI